MINWQTFSKGLTNAAVHDLVIQEEAKDLVIGTHGRSIYKADISAVQQFHKVKDNDIALFEIEPIRFSSRWGSSWSQFSKAFEPSTTIQLYAKDSGKQTIKGYYE